MEGGKRILLKAISAGFALKKYQTEMKPTGM